MRHSGPPRIIMMCGVAGSGKTTYAKRLESEGFARLSIDEYIWSTYGRFGIDYPESAYAKYQSRAESALQERLVQLIGQHRDVVLDISFWQRARRDHYKAIIDDAGGVWELVYLKTPVDILRRRLEQRRSRFDADAAFPITEDILQRFLAGFEEPLGEDEIVIEQH